MRLIDADALEIEISACMPDDYGIQTGYEICMRLVEDAPTIEPERRLPKSSGYQPEDDKPEWTGGTINSDGRIAQ